MSASFQYGYLSRDPILELVGQQKTLAYREHLIDIRNLRMQTFKHKGHVCVRCGLVGEVFRVEHQKYMDRRKGIPFFGSPQLNLYGVNEDGQLVLMTQDHIIPRSLNGANTLQNSCCMCTICNADKGAELPDLPYLLDHGWELNRIPNHRMDNRRKAIMRHMGYAEIFELLNKERPVTIHMNTQKYEKKYEIYTDGACKGKHTDKIRPGGWGSVVIHEFDIIEQLFGGEGNTTNNRMEMMGVIKGLEYLKEPSEVTVYTDSEYVRNGITTWVRGWKRNGWRTSAGAPVKNKELWQQLDKLQQKHHVTVVWVKGHSGEPGNELADKLANKGVELVRGEAA